MRELLLIGLIASFGGLIACFGGSAYAENQIAIYPLERHTNEFGDREITRSFRVESSEPFRGRFVWNLSAQQRVLTRGEQEVRVAKTSGDVSIKFRLNGLRDEVVVPLTLTVSVVVEKAEVASQQFRIWLFPDDPFLSRSEWLRSLDITLFDPPKVTAREFDNSTIPYRLVGNAAALNDGRQSGLLIIGEGVSLRQHRSLAATAIEVAASGRRVLLLAPTDGSLTVPGTVGDGLPEGRIPSELRFARERIITELDKRLDAQAWSGTDNIVPSSKLEIESRSGRVEATVSDDSRAWPWLEIRFPETGGVFVMCGFRLIEHWDSGPTPRFLIVRLFESLSASAAEEIN